MINDWNVPMDVLLASVAWLIVGVRLRAAARHSARMADLAECVNEMHTHRNTLRILIDNPAVPEPLLLLALTVSETFSERSGTMALARWIIDAGLGEHGLDNSPAALILREVEVGDPTIARIFERCIESGFVAAILRWPDTAATWRQVSLRLLAEPGHGMTVAVRASHLASGARQFGYGAAVA